MDVLKMLAELRAERQLVEEGIMVLERLARGGAKRRGRPPKWMSAHEESTSLAPPLKPKRVFSALTRKRMAEAQQKRWAAKRKKPV